MPGRGLDTGHLLPALMMLERLAPLHLRQFQSRCNQTHPPIIPVTTLTTLPAETQEAERKRIEAQGIADFQKIVSQVRVSACSSTPPSEPG